MNAGSLLGSTSRNAGGLFESVRLLHQELLQLPGINVPVFGLEDRYTAEDKPKWYPLQVQSCKVAGPAAFGFAPELVPHLLEAKLDLLQVHGIWQYPSLAAHRWHRSTKRPYIISPHGMLDPWAVKNSRWKKQIAYFFYERHHLRGASCLRALCESEARAIREFGIKNPICVIPNGIKLPDPAVVARHREGRAPRRKMLLTLGRLHPKKGLPNALRAWKQAASSAAQADWQLIIAGWDQAGHEEELQRLCTELGIRHARIPASEFMAESTASSADAEVIFTGPAFGESKDWLLSRASAFLLPSFSEGLPMSVLEAWAHGVPVLMTEFCNLPEGFAAGAAREIGTGVPSIAAGLEALFATENHELQVMGQRGHELVQTNFHWPNIASQMREVYGWMLGGGTRPASFYQA